jgi:NADPH:quinone reductase-like Zn-dependent oxidoreductase
MASRGCNCLEVRIEIRTTIAHAGLFRAAIVKGRVSSGQNVLITGIGGGVAILALQLCVAKGANVYVTSGSEDKIRQAVELGAKGGANYKDGTGIKK